MPAVDAKIGVQGENLSVRLEFRQPDKTGIRKGHGPVAITTHECAQVRLLLLYVQRNSDHSALQ